MSAEERTKLIQAKKRWLIELARKTNHAVLIAAEWAVFEEDAVTAKVYLKEAQEYLALFEKKLGELEELLGKIAEKTFGGRKA
jgi:hypothetical protein